MNEETIHAADLATTRQTNIVPVLTLLCTLLLIVAANAEETNPYMGAPVTLVKAPNGAIANKKLLDGIDEVAYLTPTIEQPAEGIWVFGGYTVAPIAVIETDEGLIAFDTGDAKHDGEILLEAIRTVSDKPIKAIIYSHSHTVMGAGVFAEGNPDVIVIGKPGLNEVVAENAAASGIPAYYPETGPYLLGRAITQFNGYLPNEGPDAWVMPFNVSTGASAFIAREYAGTGRRGNDHPGRQDAVLHPLWFRRQVPHDRMVARAQDCFLNDVVVIAPAALFPAWRCFQGSARVDCRLEINA